MIFQRDKSITELAIMTKALQEMKPSKNTQPEYSELLYTTIMYGIRSRMGIKSIAIYEREMLELFYGGAIIIGKVIRKNMKAEQICEYLINKLKKHGITVQYYHAMTTSSIYIKMDYGVLHTIRIADHKGKKGLSYRYNVEVGKVGEMRIYKNNGVKRIFFPVDKLETLIAHIISDKQYIIKQLGGEVKYRDEMKLQYVMHYGNAGFWSKCKMG